jgi:hypothetical protein
LLVGLNITLISGILRLHYGVEINNMATVIREVAFSALTASRGGPIRKYKAWVYMQTLCVTGLKMTRLATLLILLTNVSFGQKDLDYELYSQVIDDFINEGVKYGERTTQIVIINKYIPDENEVSYYGKEFLDADEQLINMSLHYDTMKIRLFNDRRLRDAIRSLEKEFYESPLLDKSKFNVDPAVTMITKREFENYFKTPFGRKIDKGWREFYKKHPGSHGVFEFSKIIYSVDYACFYVGRHSNGLSGSGDLVIARKTNGDWSIITYVNIWMS